MEFNSSTGELHNAVIRNEEVFVRDGWRSIATLNYTYVIGGFSVEQPNTSEISHYIVYRTSNYDGYVDVLDEKFNNITTQEIGKITNDTPIYWATIDRAIMINSPGFNYPLYGIQGYGLKRAEKQASANTDTKSLYIPSGLVCSFNDRFVIASGTTLFFSDPGDQATLPDGTVVNPQLSFVGENAIALNSPIYHIEQLDNGQLYVFTAAGLYTIASDATGKGQFVSGFIQYAPGQEATNYRCAASSNGYMLGLSLEGISSINAAYSLTATSGTATAFSLIPLPPTNFRHYFTEPWKPTDFRNGIMLKTVNGVIINYARQSLVIDAKHKSVSIFYIPGQQNRIKGVLKTGDGRDLYLLNNSVAFPFGDRDDFISNGFVDGYVGVLIPSDPELSPTLREIWTSSNNGGLPQFAYARGQAHSANTRTTNQIGVIVGTDKWSASGNYGTNEARSVRHQVNVRTDHLSVEIGARGSQRKIGMFDLETWGKGKVRED